MPFLAFPPLTLFSPLSRHPLASVYVATAMGAQALVGLRAAVAQTRNGAEGVTFQLDKQVFPVIGGIRQLTHFYVENK